MQYIENNIKNLKHLFLIILLHFTIAYALEVIDVCSICMVNILHNHVLMSVTCQFWV